MLLTTIEEFIKQNARAKSRDEVFEQANPNGNYMVLSNSLIDMMEMGLGYLPTSLVALPEDFSKVISNRFQEQMIKDVSHHLSDYFPNFFVAALYELQLFFNQSHLYAYIIGGIARDLLISDERRYDIEDVDITVEGDAIEAANKLAQWSRNFRVIGTFPQFGTAKLTYKDKLEIDLASTRREQYSHCGALPKIIEMGVPLKSDITRRDFTVNALALSVSKLGEVIDCTSGIHDIENQQLRLLKVISFFQDPSRIVRLLRFYCRLGFTPSSETEYLLDQFMAVCPSVYKGGGERIKYELFDFLARPESKNKAKAFQLFSHKGLHRLIDTQLPRELDLPLDIEIITERIKSIEIRLPDVFTVDDKVLIYLSLILTSFHTSDTLHAIGRLGLTRHERDVVEMVFQLIGENKIATVNADSPPSRIYHTFEDMPFAAACTGVIISPQFEDSLAALVYYYTRLKSVETIIDGRDIIAAGIAPSAKIKTILNNLLNAKLDGQVKTRLDELEWLKNNLSEN